MEDVSAPSRSPWVENIVGALAGERRRRPGRGDPRSSLLELASPPRTMLHRAPACSRSQRRTGICHKIYRMLARLAPMYFTPSNPSKHAMLLILKITRTSTKRCMLIFVKPGADISRRCALAVIAYTFLLTHPHPAVRGSLHAGTVCVELGFCLSPQRMFIHCAIILCSAISSRMEK